MIESITRILDLCGTENTVLPPTVLYNEGWLLRLVLDWLDRNREVVHPLAFMADARWYSEALLPTPFLPKVRGDPQGEAYTHADGIIGQITLNPGERGDARLLPGLQQLVVLEAKLASGLARGTRNAPAYDQAARTAACMVQMLSKAGINPASVKQLAFFVLAPDSQIRSGVFKDLVTRDSIRKKVEARIKGYAGPHQERLEKYFKPALAHLELGLLSWESILEGLPETPEVDLIWEFYRQCLKFNPVRGKMGS
jgi:hypothetical protein